MEPTIVHNGTTNWLWLQFLEYCDTTLHSINSLFKIFTVTVPICVFGHATGNKRPVLGLRVNIKCIATHVQ